ncbi:hypothetical protein BBK14_24155 [Parafrankia soli]|uniref:Uncharacterized protein n=1 Tax=Parafrankia soli TaxID=2599596 RepID=A0A1S1PPQ0_9ACTN|nr:hypothetical protein BBK14_24155 [Parafrankia soli]
MFGVLRSEPSFSARRRSLLVGACASPADCRAAAVVVAGRRCGRRRRVAVVPPPPSGRALTRHTLTRQTLRRRVGDLMRS